MHALLRRTKAALARDIWKEAPDLRRLLAHADDTRQARDRFFGYLNDLERKFFNIDDAGDLVTRHIIERDNAKECIRVLRNIIRTENEHLTGFSALRALAGLAAGSADTLAEVGEGFLCEILHLLKGAHAHTRILTRGHFSLLPWESAGTAQRSRHLDRYAGQLQRAFRRFACGLDPSLERERLRLAARVRAHFGASDENWRDYRWHLRHVIRDRQTLARLVRLARDEQTGLELAERTGIPFQITPYYLTLFHRTGRDSRDACVRAQVLPSESYCRGVAEARAAGREMDFMGERATSPVDLVTRRYAQIAILKPFDSCPQICVYCQRNWEVQPLESARVTPERVRRALRWLRGNRSITEVLVTGGDPFTLDNRYLDWLLGEVAAMRHVERIRIGTRVPVTLPCRLDQGLRDILARYHEPGRRDIALVTHVEHAREITPETLAAVSAIRRLGISVYNQQVFTYYTSRRYETCFLRRTLALCGIVPYYTFNTKGKEETSDFRVPIARIEQERKEEARLLPGLQRTDDPVFNVPRQGKSSLVAWQDHEPVMILPDGRRVYRFYPWESRLSLTDDYLYTDVSIYDYLKRLDADGEDIEDYLTIWYYF